MNMDNNNQQLNNSALPKRQYVWDIEKIMESARRVRNAAKKEKEWEKKQVEIQQVH
ncbi:hypothetical protein L6248_01940 [Candidatus Parcubacteria bacterium]|nr:hypothetical protein [Candidatus Parcubacteria bacterium]MCG2700872.1 hypothetical protein [Candidatus Parcubacteria bacterium]